SPGPLRRAGAEARAADGTRLGRLGRVSAVLTPASAHPAVQRAQYAQYTAPLAATRQAFAEHHVALLVPVGHRLPIAGLLAAAPPAGVGALGHPAAERDE